MAKASDVQYVERRNKIFPTSTCETLQVREEYPICVQSQNTTKHKTKFITLLQHYNNMFRPKIIGHRQVVYETYGMHALIYCVDGVGGI